MIVAKDTNDDGFERVPVSYGDITYIEKLIHLCTLEENKISEIERRVANVEYVDELYEIISLLKENQKKNLNDEMDDALRRAI